MGTVDLLGLGIYSMPEASRLTRIPVKRLRRWLLGYTFGPDRRRSERLIVGQIPKMDGALAMSFLDLLESRCLDVFLERGISWSRLREMHERAKARLGHDHPFSTGQFKNIGPTIFADDESEGPLEDLLTNQGSLRGILGPLLQGIEFGADDIALRWYPLDPVSRRIVIDPMRAFGKPIVASRGVPTWALAAAYRAERSYAKVARWYDVDEPSVRDAVRFERRLAA